MQGRSQDWELGGKSTNKQTKKFKTSNKHSFNKLSTKKNTQNYYFLKYYNAIIFENGTCRFFKSSTSKHSTTNQ